MPPSNVQEMEVQTMANKVHVPDDRYFGPDPRQKESPSTCTRRSRTCR